MHVILLRFLNPSSLNILNILEQHARFGRAFLLTEEAWSMYRSGQIVETDLGKPFVHILTYDIVGLPVTTRKVSILLVLAFPQWNINSIIGT